MVRLRYNGSESSTAVLFDKIFMANSLFDPDFSGTGHQPLGFDEWMRLYNRYRVHSSSMNCQTINKSTTVTSLPTTVIFSTPNTSAIAGSEEAQEMGDAKEATSGVSTGPASVRVYAPTKTTTQVLGVRSITNSSEFSGTDSTNPATPWFWRLVVQNFDATALNCILDYDISFVAEFFSPRQLDQS